MSRNVIIDETKQRETTQEEKRDIIGIFAGKVVFDKNVKVVLLNRTDLRSDSQVGPVFVLANRIIMCIVRRDKDRIKTNSGNDFNSKERHIVKFEEFLSDERSNQFR